MSLLLVAYPELMDADSQRLRAFRDIHDTTYKDIVGLHFTIVFPIDNISQDEFVAHVRSVIQVTHQIRFACRCATVVPDHASDDWFVFLVPDEGYSEIVKLHDRLYTGPFAEHLLLNIPFIPHIAIATSKDRYECKRLADTLNEERLEIIGRIRQLNAVTFDGHKVKDIEKLPLLPLSTTVQV